ncbi:MAG: hypothetical protein U0183_08725 [Polyangiaceae bacterium]
MDIVIFVERESRLQDALAKAKEVFFRPGRRGGESRIVGAWVGDMSTRIVEDVGSDRPGPRVFSEVMFGAEWGAWLFHEPVDIVEVLAVLTEASGGATNARRSFIPLLPSGATPAEVENTSLALRRGAGALVQRPLVLDLM